MQNEPGELRACMKNHLVNAHQQVIWLRSIFNAGCSRWVERSWIYDFIIYWQSFKCYGMACVVPASMCTGTGQANVIGVWAGGKSISCDC